MSDNAVVATVNTEAVLYPDVDPTAVSAKTDHVLVVEADDTDIVSTIAPQIVTLASLQVSVVAPPGENVQAVGIENTQFLLTDNTSIQVVGLNITGIPTLDPDTPARNWIDYVANWRADTIPVKISTIAAGDVYQYTFADGSLLYRLVGSDPYTDGFYQNWDGSAVSGLVLNRAMQVI